MKKPKTHKIKSKQIEEWITEGRAVLKNDLIPEFLRGWPENYYLFDGVSLIIRDTIEKKNGIMYDKYSEYLIFINAVEKRANLTNQSTNSPNASFPGNVKVSVHEFKTMIGECDKTLATEFSISPNVLDFSMSSLTLLDKAIKKALKKFEAGDFNEKYAVIISAYCGEVMRRKIDGEWKIIGNTEGILEQILIMEKSDAQYSYRPEIPIALVLSGDVPKGSNLRIEVDGQLHKYGLIKGNEVHYNIH